MFLYNNKLVIYFVYAISFPFRCIVIFVKNEIKIIDIWDFTIEIRYWCGYFFIDG